MLATMSVSEHPTTTTNVRPGGEGVRRVAFGHGARSLTASGTLADLVTVGQLRFSLALRLDPVLDAQQHSACHQRPDRPGGLEAEHFTRVV